MSVTVYVKYSINEWHTVPIVLLFYTYMHTELANMLQLHQDDQQFYCLSRRLLEVLVNM